MSDAPSGATPLRVLLALPGPVLDLMSGDEPSELGGRRLDPRFRFLSHAARSRPALTDMPLEQARVAAAQAITLAALAPQPGVAWRELSAPDGAGGRNPARLYTPERVDPAAPLMLWMHGGGGVIGDLDTSHGVCTVLAEALRGPVLSLDYRLAPEHPYPAGVDDALAAYRWARDSAAELGAAPGVAIGGDSAGGWMAALVCQRLRSAGEAQPALQLLVYPAVDMASQTQSIEIYGDVFPLTRPLSLWFRSALLPAGVDPAAPEVSPLRADALEGLAPAVVVTAGFDALVDQGEAYAHRLVAAADATLYRCYDALPHGFLNFAGLVPAAETALREIAGLARQGYEGLLPVSAHALAAHAGAADAGARPGALQPAPTASATEANPSA